MKESCGQCGPLLEASAGSYSSCSELAMSLLFLFRPRYVLALPAVNWLRPYSYNGPRYQRALALCDFFFNRDDTEGTNSSKMLCSMFLYVSFCKFCVRTDFVVFG